ncbi:hypothetical protein [Muricoccus vinaceus]|uniref:Uncharacterized protein n=1 Tax=Muricoccus vinaceus TaxID=424704 RepID=A0ABV6IUN1_9PROT
MTENLAEAPAAATELLHLSPVENRAEVRSQFRRWRTALAADKRFPAAGKPEPAEEAEAVKDGFQWKLTLRPKGLAALDFSIRLSEISASYTPLDRNNQAAIGRDRTDGSHYILRQWYDTKRIGSRALNLEALAKYQAPRTAELLHAESKPNPGRGRLYIVVARLNDTDEAIAEQTYAALEAFHRVAAAARADFV